jgi:ribosomal-protein-alanine N-acetyltransferase
MENLSPERIEAGLPTISTPRLLLRPFIIEDALALHQLVKEREIASTTLNIPHPYEEQMASVWISTHAPGWANQEMAVFAITEATAGLVGAISLRTELAHQRGELGYWIGVPFWGRGYATEATRAVIQFGLERMKLNRIHAAHLTRNPASGRVMIKVGMTFEGVLRQHILKWGQFEDVAKYSILRSEYQPENNLPQIYADERR